MLRSSSSSYICWRCLARRPVKPSPAGRQLQKDGFQAVRERTISVSPRHYRGLATVHHGKRSSDKDGRFFANYRTASAPADERSIRTQLRKWEIENPASPLLSIKDTGAAMQPSLSDPISELDLEQFNRRTQFDEEGFVDLQSEATGLGAGDLIELCTDAWRLPIVAVCLGNFHGFDHFYTETGKWFAAPGISTKFVVKNFIQDPADLKPLVDSVPSVDDLTTLDQLRDLNAGPSRELGANLIWRMQNFQLRSRMTYQTHIDKFVHAQKHLGPHEKVMSLGEIADILLPATIKKETGHFGPEHLYAVHMALTMNDVAFRPLSQGRRQQSYLYEVKPKEETDIIEQIDERLRALYEDIAQRRRVANDNFLSKNLIGRFVLKARRAIDQSRQHRPWTPHGMLGPSQGPLKETDGANWQSTDFRIITLMHMWAAADRFSRSSRLNWVGSGLLRLIDRYGEATLMDQTVGWTFLQEIGWIKPWDIQSRYHLRLPGSNPERRGGVTAESSGAEERPLMTSDQFATSRRDFAGSTVYCIDAESAEDIDDGISVEKDSGGNYWIHIHVANPTSRIDPNSPAANRAKVIPQTIYLAGHQEPMMNFDGIREAFSLGPNKPSLTFSAKVNEHGDLLDYSISPSTVRDVVNITPEHVSEICGHDQICSSGVDEEAAFSVGTAPEKKEGRNREMSAPSDLSKEQLEELHTLNRLTKAVHQKRLDKGAMPAFFSRPMVKVSLDGVAVATTPDGFFQCSGDPYIQISHVSQDGNMLVSSAMQLAGEVAARWCQARGVVVPYRVQPKAARNKEAFKNFTQNVFYPQIAAGKRPSEEQYRRLSQLIGTTDISTYPAQNFTMGIDLYTKATSPLRRYTDLIVHWQIGAALAEEARFGKSLVGRTVEQNEIGAAGRSSFLPFTRDNLENQILPLLRLRERHARWLDNVDGPAEWILQALVRAWKFGEGSRALPASFRLKITDVRAKRFVAGTLDWFDCEAAIRPEDLTDFALMSDLKSGDLLEVELANVNVYRKEIWVKPLKRV